MKQALEGIFVVLLVVAVVMLAGFFVWFFPAPINFLFAGMVVLAGIMKYLRR